jgi:hypothetical protein
MELSSVLRRAGLSLCLSGRKKDGERAGTGKQSRRGSSLGPGTKLEPDSASTRPALMINGQQRIP